MYVNIDVTAVSGCNISSNVYRATGPCTGVEISCLFGAPLDDMHLLNGLTIGTVYYVQVCYPLGGICGNAGSAQYCIDVGIPDEPCDTCTDPCGTATGFPTDPTIPEVIAECETDAFAPPLQPGSLNRFCFDIFPTNTTVSFNVIITSNCPVAGNVTSFSWQLFNSPACGAPIQSGTLANLQFTGLTVGNRYVFCYTFNVPTVCTHTQHCPFFVGATTPLPVTWIGMDATLTGDKKVAVEWSTASERNCDHFTVERSRDAHSFEVVGRVDGQGDSFVTNHYFFLDPAPFSGLSYYRVKQTDRDSTFDHSRVVAVVVPPALDRLVISPNPVQGDALISFHSDVEGSIPIMVYDAHGKSIYSRNYEVVLGPNTVTLGTAQLAQGVYMLSFGDHSDRRTLRFVKE